jgi:uncharacterized protein (DUF362 family)
MSKLSRRDFLKTAAASASALATSAVLEACGRLLPASPPGGMQPASEPMQLPGSPTPVPSTPVPSASPTESQTALPTSTNPPALPPDLVVTRGGEPEALVRRAIQTLGGMARFVPSGAKVIVKPNICVAYRTYEYAATTNPWVVGELVRMCFEAGAASVKVMDFPFNGTQEQAYQMSGIREQVEAAGGEMAYMPYYNFIPTKIPNGKVLKETAVYQDVLKADVLINVPVAKNHGSSRLTLGMKNLMGVILDRSILHMDIHQSIADLNSLVRPQLTVVDAVRILTANGPTGGSLAWVKKLDTVIAGPDIIAADSFAASLFGLKPEDLDFLVAGAGMGLGRSDLQNLRIEQIQL